ncbi:MAG: choice-of-anchor D domain-containing protein [Alphaproteobacteria bacterium]|nr:choice-of-anchor D domain-containing protein [Alphaproteobacteria bacterium]
MKRRARLKVGFLAVLMVLGCFFSPAFAQHPGFSDPGSAAIAGTGGGFVASTPVVDGGAVPMGATAQVVVRFRNDGGQPVKTGLVRLYPSSNVAAAVALNQCQEDDLAPGAECAVALTVKGLQAGPWRLEMLMSHNARTRLVTSTISGSVETVEGAGDKVSSDIETIPAELDFGSLTNSQTLVQPVILRNITSNEIEISDIYIDASEQAGYSLNTVCEKLAAGQSCMATVTWSPKLKGRSSGVLVVRHNGPAALSSVSLKGEYAPDNVSKADVFPQAVPGRGLLVSSREEVDFGTDIEKASAITISLVNSGDAPLTIQGIKTSGSDNGVSFKESGCLVGTVLAPIEACPLTITWSPTRLGALLDDVQVLHSGARGVLVLPVRGEASATVSADQKSITLSGGADPFSKVPPISVADLDLQEDSAQDADLALIKAARKATGGGASGVSNTNFAKVLDGYKITSFSPTRAIINGPGGSRLVFNEEETVIGGVPWLVIIQKSGIEFVHQEQRILLLFDRSLSSFNRLGSSSGSNADSNSGEGGSAVNAGAGAGNAN